MLGAYTFWDAMWTMIVFFAWIMFITWVIMLMIDNFRRKDHGGGAKVVPTTSPSCAPARPDTAGDYGAETGYAPRETTSTASELARLNELRTDGAISDAEFEDLKTRTIAAS